MANQGQGGDYKAEYNDFVRDMSAAERDLMPDPQRVAVVASEEPPGIAKSGAPMKVSLGGADSASISRPAAPPPANAGPSVADSVAWPPQMPFPAPYMGSYGGAPNPFMGPPMGAGYAWPGFMDPGAMAAAMGGGKGGMPFMPMPGMPPMMYPMGGMPPGMGGGKGGGKGGDGAGKEKTQRRKRKGKNSKAAEDAGEADDTAAANRSEELNEVRKAGQGKCKLTWEQVLPRAIEFASDQHGSRFLQTKLDESTDPERLKLFNEILPHTKAMSRDQFGNFVVQKLFDIGSADQKRKLAEQLEGDVLALSKEQHGCRVIQKALQLLPRDAQTKLAIELHAHVGDCIENMHGNHVIQKCIEQMPPDSVNFVIEPVSERVEGFAEHMYGCRVIQRLLEHCAAHQLQVMLEKIEASTAQLAQHPYGNYVVQHMLEHGRPEDKRKILEVVRSNIIDFAKNKCSSNVVEKCFEVATVGEHADALKDDRQRLFSALLDLRPGESLSPLQQLTDDRFGNYIVQRMLEHSRGDEREILKIQLLQRQQSLKSSTTGKHILGALQKEFGINLLPEGE